MKHAGLTILVCVGLTAVLPAQTNQPPDTTPSISLFNSVEKVKIFLKTQAKADYSDKYLSQVTLSGIPKKGICWVYYFAFKKPRMGGEAVIYHFMDGKIEESQLGP